MRDLHRFGLGLGLCVAFGAVAIGLAISRSGDGGLPVSDLLRVEAIPDDASVDVQHRYLFEVLGGERRFTDVDFAERFSPVWEQQFTVGDLNAITDGIHADVGPVRHVRTLERGPEAVASLAVAADGSTGGVELSVDPDTGRIDGFRIGDSPVASDTLPGWRAALALVAGGFSVAGAMAAWRHGARREAWLLLGASVVAFSGVLVLSRTEVVYAVGRSAPALSVLFATALLVRRTSSRWVLTAAAVAGALGALATFTRAPERVGHPPVPTIVDSEAAMRTVLVASVALVACVMAWVAVTYGRRVRRSGGPARLALGLTAGIGIVWAAAAATAGMDYSVGGGTIATGVATAATSSAFAFVPAVVWLRLVSPGWEHPELATLVIDLERDGSDLRAAIAEALADPSLEVLRSMDGTVLVDDRGHEVVPDNLAGGRTLTRIQSGPRLVGALLHSSDLQRDPARLEAVAAAAGMALEVSRLNQQVMAQLDEVEASRLRILEAGDTARRRIERDLHDGAQQRLVALGLHLQSARREARSSGEEHLAELMESATRDVRETLDEIRAVSRGGQPALLAERGLASAVDALAERAPVPVRIGIGPQRLPVAVERTAYFVIAEALTNVAKHAGASRVEVSVAGGRGVACVTVADDGHGGAVVAPGSGLEGLHDRVAAAGGTLQVSSGLGGTTLKATIPCE